MALEFFSGLRIGSKIKKSFAYGPIPMVELPEKDIKSIEPSKRQHKGKELKPTKILPIKKSSDKDWDAIIPKSDPKKNGSPIIESNALTNITDRNGSNNPFENGTKLILTKQLSAFDPDQNVTKTSRCPKLKAFFDPSIGENEKKKKLLLDLLIEQFRLNIRDQKMSGLPEKKDERNESNSNDEAEVSALIPPNQRKSTDKSVGNWDNFTNEQILNLGLLLFIEEIARNPNHPLHQLINHKLKAEWTKKVRGYSAGHMNWLLNTTYWLRMTPIDLFYNGREMSKFDAWTGYHGITGNPLMMLRGFFYLKGFVIGVVYFYHSGKFDYVIFCNTLNDGVWFTANTINITDNFIQLHRALKYHTSYHEPTMANVFHSHWLAAHASWLNSAGACSVMFSGLYIFFDLPRDFSRDLYLLWEVHKHPERFLDASKEFRKRLNSLMCNFICNLAMGCIARVGITFPAAAAVLSVAIPWTIMAIFLFTFAYGAWKLSKIKKDENYVMPCWIPGGTKALPWTVGTSLLVLAPTGIALMVLAGGATGAAATAMLASGGAIFVAAAMIFGLSTYYFLRSRGIDQAVCVRLSFMSGMMGLLIAGAAMTLLFAGGPFSTIAVVGVLFVMALGAFREWNKDMSVIRASCNKDKRNRMLDEAWKSYAPLFQGRYLTEEESNKIKKDPVHQMVALEAYKLRECILILKSSSEKSNQQISNRVYKEGVYTLTRNEDGKTAMLEYQNSEGKWRTKSVPIKSIPKAILKGGWNGEGRVIRPMMKEAKFIRSNGAMFQCGENSRKERDCLKHRYVNSWCSNFGSKNSSNKVTASNDPVLLDNSYVMRPMEIS